LPAAPPALAADPATEAAGAPVATTTAPAADSWWDGLWQRADQRAYQALNRGDAASARALAKDPAIAAAAAFRGDDYAAAAETWSGQDDADAHYNRGNALAKAGKLPEALAAYDEALKRSPGMDDAIANRKLVADLLQQQQQQQDGQQQDGQKQEGQQQDGKQQDGQQQQGQQQDGNQQTGQQQDGKQQDGQQQDGEQQDGQQQDGEQSDGKQQDGEQSPADSAESKSADSEEQASDSKKPDSANSSADEDKDGMQPDAQPQSAQAQAEQQAAEAAAREQMQQALDQADKPGDAKPGEPVRTLTPEERVDAERAQALQQWLRRIPDDPGGLLRRKFELEHRRRQAEQQQDGAPQ
jgi:Ca-activated chloride channel family protein